MAYYVFLNILKHSMFGSFFELTTSLIFKNIPKQTFTFKCIREAP